MSITGSNDTTVHAIQLYKDNTMLTKCQMYGAYGDDVCVILVPVYSKQHVRYVTISTATTVTLCEVQIFAGKILYYYFV